MDEKLEAIRTYLIEKMSAAIKADKITSTEQLLNMAKAYSELCEPLSAGEKADAI